MSRFDFKGHRPEMPRATRPVVNAPPQPRFFFMSHPNRYDVIDGELLPHLAKFRLAPGVNGVEPTGDYLVAKAGFERRGWSVIPWNCLEDFEAFGESYSEYLQYFEGKGGAIYTEIWVRPVQTTGGVPRWNFDEAGYRKFQRDLIKGGHVPEPDPSRLDVIESKAQARIDRIEPRAANAPQLQRALDRDRELLEAVSTLKSGEASLSASARSKKSPARRGRKPKATQ